jgi:hypothetical protein
VSWEAEHGGGRAAPQFLGGNGEPAADALHTHP